MKRSALKRRRDFSTWQETRARILKRDKYTCQTCGNPGDQVHHIMRLGGGGSRFKGPRNRDDLLETICDGCHKVKTDFSEKKLQSALDQIEAMGGQQDDSNSN